MPTIIRLPIGLCSTFFTAAVLTIMVSLLTPASASACIEDNDCIIGPPIQHPTCTAGAYCHRGVCFFPNDGVTCDDGEFCNGTDSCDNGRCAKPNPAIRVLSTTRSATR